MSVLLEKYFKMSSGDGIKRDNSCFCQNGLKMRVITIYEKSKKIKLFKNERKIMKEKVKHIRVLYIGILYLMPHCGMGY